MYLISYDLNKPGQHYGKLIEAIKEVSSYWWHHLDSVWIVGSSLSAVEIRNRLSVHIDSNDELLVVALAKEAAWKGFDQRGSNWLRNNL